MARVVRGGTLDTWIDSFFVSRAADSSDENRITGGLGSERGREESQRWREEGERVVKDDGTSLVRVM